MVARREWHTHRVSINQLNFNQPPPGGFVLESSVPWGVFFTPWGGVRRLRAHLLIAREAFRAPTPAGAGERGMNMSEAGSTAQGGTANDAGSNNTAAQAGGSQAAAGSRTFTQEEVNSLLAKERRDTQAFDYQSECHCAKTACAGGKDEDLFDYQSECHCAKTKAASS